MPLFFLDTRKRSQPSPASGSTRGLTTLSETLTACWFERQLSEVDVVSREMLEFQSIEAIKRCVSAGMGVSVLPAVSVETELAGGGLSELRWHEPDRVGTLMAWNERRWGSPALRAFLGTAREVFSAS